MSRTIRRAIAAAASLQPDVVLMDVRLQGKIEGVEAARQIRATNEVPIVFISAHARALKLADFPGRHLSIVKPFAPRQIREALEAVLCT